MFTIYLNFIDKKAFDENLNIHGWDPKYSTNAIIRKIIRRSENAEHSLLLFIVVIHLCSAFSDYTAANKKHADDFSDDDVCQVFWIPPMDI